VRIAVVNLKGGTSKTTSSMFLAAALARRGRTLLVDTDPQGSALSWSETAEADGYELPFAIMGLPTKDVHRKLARVADDYEYVVIDTPPGEIPITRSVLKAVEVALVATSPSVMDVSRFRPTLDLLADVEDVNEDLAYYVLITRARRISREGKEAREVMEEMGLPVLKAEIPHLSFYSEAYGSRIEDLAEYGAVADELVREFEAEEVA
jgi:chromosome partitioning protein